ncbi:MAG: molybdopterin dinucleotide binding domain-containing protein [Thermoplasmata archaeon]
MTEEIATMRVWVSSLPGSGVAKINPADYEKMGLTDEDSVLVRSAHGSVTLKVVRDDIWEENIIRIRKPDADTLRVRTGDAVFVSVVKKEEPEEKKKKK